MSIRILFTYYIVNSIVALQAQNQLSVPLSGIYGQDYIIVNYVDWGLGNSYKDHYCSSKTYDGHQGTDFTIKSFAAQDSGVDVLASINGRVNFVVDGYFDREKKSVPSKKLGNYIGISHSGKLQTYYGHLRKGSIIVQVGDSVKAGQKIAQVGSSGNSESPHLHFELWYDSAYYVDPFAGPCGNSSSYWQNEPAFDSSFGIWDSGMCNYLCSLDTLKEDPERTDTFTTFDPTITYWNLEYGLRQGDSLYAEWYNPLGILWYSYGYKATRDWWYFFFWNNINTPGIDHIGKWTIKFYRNNSLNSTRDFNFLNGSVQLGREEHQNGIQWWLVYGKEKILVYNVGINQMLKVFNSQGELIKAMKITQSPVIINKKEFNHGQYYLKYELLNGITEVKKLFF